MIELRRWGGECAPHFRRRSPLHNNSFRSHRRTLILIFAMALACRRSYPLGKLSVRTVDANNAPVSAVAADLFKNTPSGLVYWRASRTGLNGFAIFGEKNGGVIEGDYIIRVSPMPWLKLAPGEANDRAVKLKEGDNIVVTFRIVPIVPKKSGSPIPPYAP
jgi:hypothetical protein